MNNWTQQMLTGNAKIQRLLIKARGFKSKFERFRINTFVLFR